MSKSFNLYEVAQGSIHYDHTIGSGNKFFGKLIFDVRMSQRIAFQLQIKSLSCGFTEDLTYRKYFYNYIVTDNKTTVESGNSKTFINRNLVVGNSSKASEWMRRGSTMKDFGAVEVDTGGPGSPSKANWSKEMKANQSDSVTSNDGTNAKQIAIGGDLELGRKVSGHEPESDKEGDDIYHQMKDRKHITWKIPSPITSVS